MVTPLIIDYRNDLAKAPQYHIGTRIGPATYFTLHYNGPRVKGYGNPDSELAQLRFDAKYHISKNWSNSPGHIVRGDGIMYHGATLSNGKHYQLRDFDAQLFHCGVAEGNHKSISWHVPLGLDQVPTPQLVTGLYQIFNYFRELYGIEVAHFKAHQEWKPTDCPGIHLLNVLKSWRLNNRSRLTRIYTTLANLNVRQKPSDDLVSNPIAGVIPRGTQISVDAIVAEHWAHLASEWGFVHTDFIR